MKNIQLLCLALWCFLLAPDSLRAAGVAVISHADITPYRIAIAAFREQVGLDVHEYHLGVRNKNESEVKAAIRQQQPELIFALGKSALNFSRKFNSNAPVVFAFVLHPEDRFRHQHESGIAMAIAPEQQFKMLLEISPDINKVAVVYDPSKSEKMIQQAKASCRNLDITLVAMPAANQQEAANAIARVMPKVDAMWMIPDTTVLTSTTFKQMIRLSISHAVALVGLAPKHVRAGSLFSLSFDSRALGLQAGHMAKQILKGNTLTELVAPNVHSLALNIQAAERLGIHTPPSLLKKVAHLYPENLGMQK